MGSIKTTLIQKLYFWASERLGTYKVTYDKNLWKVTEDERVISVQRKDYKEPDLFTVYDYYADDTYYRSK